MDYIKTKGLFIDLQFRLSGGKIKMPGADKEPDNDDLKQINGCLLKRWERVRSRCNQTFLSSSGW